MDILEADIKKALIFGITGQDGAYLTEFLLDKGYEIHGVKRRSSSHNTERIDPFYSEMQNPEKRLILYYGDLTDASNITHLIQSIQPDEIYNLAAQSHVKTSFELPEYTAEVDALGTLRILEAIRLLNLEKKSKILPSLYKRIIRPCARNPSNRKNPFLSSFTLWRL